MHSPILGSVFALAAIALLTGDARADRALTPEEQASLAAALEAEGCSGGDAEHDDDEIEVDDAQCADGTYDFELTTDFEIKERERDD